MCGWVGRRREHGEHLAFVDLRDHTGVVQCVVDGAHDLRSEYVLRITGTVRTRPEGTANDALATGDVEVGDCTVEVLSAAQPPPFPIDERADDVDEMIRLRYRYLDLRRERMQRNLRIRATVNSAIRGAMERQGFVEVETPMLMPSTPEGAREFLVPSRQVPGSFYALPQSPQLFKQLLMVGGVDRYYQIARLPGTRTSRADRQYEFMQLDAEASFVTEDEVLEFIGEAVLDAAEAVLGERPGPDRADDLARRHGPLRRRQARPALRHGAGRAHARCSRPPSSRRSRRPRPSRGCGSRGRRATTAATSSTASPTGPRRWAPRASCGCGSATAARWRARSPSSSPRTSRPRSCRPWPPSRATSCCWSPTSG